MDALVTALGTSLTPTALWGAIAPVAPLVGVGVVVGLGYMVLRKAVKGIGHGKGRI